MSPKGDFMSEFSPNPHDNPESFIELRDSALEWIGHVGRDTEIDRLVVTPEGSRVWQRLMGKFVDEVPPAQYEKALIQWRRLHQPKLDRDLGVREKNLFLASVANEVEEAASTDGDYLRFLLATLNKSALLVEDTDATRRSQFMGMWVLRKINTDFSS